MSDRLPLDLGPAINEPESDESATVRLTRRNREALDRGVHPATMLPLVSDGRTCGDCPHSERVAWRDRAWWKCHRHRLGLSHSAASDIRVSWPACTLIDGEVGR